MVARWAVFLTVMTAIGLLALRLAIARPAVRRVPGTTLRGITVAFAVASTLGLVAIPIYLEESTAVDSLHSFFDVNALVPLWRTTAFGRGYVDLLICFALFTAAAWIALWVDRPEREYRSIAELLAAIGVVGAAAAVLSCRERPGTPPRPRRAGLRSRSTGSTWARARSGSAA